MLKAENLFYIYTFIPRRRYLQISLVYARREKLHKTGQKELYGRVNRVESDSDTQKNKH